MTPEVSTGEKEATAKIVVLGFDRTCVCQRRTIMELDPVLLSRVQFAFVVSFHIIFPSFTIGLAAWLATIEGMRLATGNTVYRRVYDFWLNVFALSFGMGVVSGIVMAFQFGTNWSVLSERTGAIQGPLL